MGLPGVAPSPSLCLLSRSHPSPNLHPLCSLASKFTECFPLTHWVQTKEVPLPWASQRSLLLVSRREGIPSQPFSFPRPPIAMGLGLGPICVGGSFSGLWQVRRWNPGDGIVLLGSAPTWQSGLPRSTRPRAACLFVSKPHVLLIRSYQRARAALARVGGPLWS